MPLPITTTRLRARRPGAYWRWMNLGGSWLPRATPEIGAHAELLAVLPLEDLDLELAPRAISAARSAR